MANFLTDKVETWGKRYITIKRILIKTWFEYVTNEEVLNRMETKEALKLRTRKKQFHISREHNEERQVCIICHTQYILVAGQTEVNKELPSQSFWVNEWQRREWIYGWLLVLEYARLLRWLVNPLFRRTLYGTFVFLLHTQGAGTVPSSQFLGTNIVCFSAILFYTCRGHVSMPLSRNYLLDKAIQIKIEYGFHDRNTNVVITRLNSQVWKG